MKQAKSKSQKGKQPPVKKSSSPKSSNQKAAAAALPPGIPPLPSVKHESDKTTREKDPLLSGLDESDSEIRHTNTSRDGAQSSDKSGDQEKESEVSRSKGVGLRKGKVNLETGAQARRKRRNRKRREKRRNREGLMRRPHEEESRGTDTASETLIGVGTGFVDFEFTMSYSKADTDEVDKLTRQIQSLYSAPGNKRKVSTYEHERLGGDLELVKAFALDQARKYKQEVKDFRELGTLYDKMVTTFEQITVGYQRWMNLTWTTLWRQQCHRFR